MSPKEPASPGTPAAAPAGPAAERDPLERIDLHLIRDAISAARGSRFDPPLSAPATSEAILRALHAD